MGKYYLVHVLIQTPPTLFLQPFSSGWNETFVNIISHSGKTYASLVELKNDGKKI